MSVMIKNGASIDEVAVKLASTVPVLADPALVVSLSPNSAAAPSKLTDGTNFVTVKAGFTAPQTVDPALVVSLSPNSAATPITGSGGGTVVSKAGATAAQVADVALVVALSPNSPALIGGNGGTVATKAASTAAVAADVAMVVTMSPNSAGAPTSITDGITSSTKLTVKAANVPATTGDFAAVVVPHPSGWTKNATQQNTAFSGAAYGKGVYDEVGRKLVNAGAPQTNSRIIKEVYYNGANSPYFCAAIAGQRFVITAIQLTSTSSAAFSLFINISGLESTRSQSGSSTGGSVLTTGTMSTTVYGNGQPYGSIYLDLSANPIYGAINTAMSITNNGSFICSIWGHYQVG
jgi:hypothetical protein